MTVDISRAELRDADTLKQIAVGAKAYWGYPPEFITRWAGTFDINAEYFARRNIFVARSNEKIVGWYSLMGDLPTLLLDDLWIEASHIRHGIGRMLFSDAVARAREAGASFLELEAEPNAVGFYERMGARYLRDTYSELERVLPIMGLEISQSGPRQE